MEKEDTDFLTTQKYKLKYFQSNPGKTASSSIDGEDMQAASSEIKPLSVLSNLPWYLNVVEMNSLSFRIKWMKYKVQMSLYSKNGDQWYWPFTGTGSGFDFRISLTEPRQHAQKLLVWKIQKIPGFVKNQINLNSVPYRRTYRYSAVPVLVFTAMVPSLYSSVTNHTTWCISSTVHSIYHT